MQRVICLRCCRKRFDLLTARTTRRLTAGLILLTCAVSPAAADIVGRASAIDGDTIEIQGKRIRLHGIDAPESAQFCRDKDGQPYACGRIAAHVLSGYLANSRPTRCEVRDRDRYGREVATCYRADGKDAAAFLVRHGHALDWKKYSGGAYAAEQAAAQAAREGMWQGEFDQPWDWRRGQRKVTSNSGTASFARSPAHSDDRRDCAIKGNINRRGDRIYHMPGSRSYAETRISPAHGERWFCSEEDAVRAGWRAPRG